MVVSEQSWQGLPDEYRAVIDELVPELNYQCQFAQLLTGATACRVNRLHMTSGRPMQLESLLAELPPLAKVAAPRRFLAA